MKRFIKFSIVLCAIFLLSNVAWAKNYYVINGFKMIARSGNSYEMAVMTKVYDEDTAKKVMKEKSQPMGRWQSTYSDYASGSEQDRLYKTVFNNQPVSSLYVTLKDMNGHETRINFVDAPMVVASPIANAFVQQFKANYGIDARVVYPVQ